MSLFRASTRPSRVLLVGNRTTILLNEILTGRIFALSLDIVICYAGLVSLGHALFYGVGAYAAALSCCTTPVGVRRGTRGDSPLCGLAGRRLSSPREPRTSRSITLAFAELLYSAVFEFDFTGGSDALLGFEAFVGLEPRGVTLGYRLRAPRYEIGQQFVFYYLAPAQCGTLVPVRSAHDERDFGSVLQSIRESEERRIHRVRLKQKQHAEPVDISSGMAGLAGDLSSLPREFVRD